MDIFQPFVVNTTMFNSIDVVPKRVSVVPRATRLRPTITICSDDAYKTDLTLLFPALRDYVTPAMVKGTSEADPPELDYGSIPFTTAVPTSDVGVVEGRLTWDDLQTLKDSGIHSTASHGLATDDGAVSGPDGLSGNSLEAMFAESQLALTSRGLDGNIYVAPHHQMTPEAMALGSKYFEAHRAAEAGSSWRSAGINLPPIDTYNLMTLTLSNALMDSGGASLDDYKETLKFFLQLWRKSDGTVYEDEPPTDDYSDLVDGPGEGIPGWLILNVHEMTAGRVSSLIDLIDYCFDRSVHGDSVYDVQFLTFSDALAQFQNYFDAGYVGDYSQHSFGVSPRGDVRAKRLECVDELVIWSRSFGEATDEQGETERSKNSFVTISHVPTGTHGNSVLLQGRYNEDTDEYGNVVCKAGALLPYGFGMDIPCGNSSFPWSEMWAEEIGMRAYYGNSLKLVTNFGYRDRKNGETITVGIPENVKLLGIMARVASTLVGTDEWACELTGGLDATLGAGLSVNSGSEYFWFYDPADDSSNRVATSATTNVNVVIDPADTVTSGRVTIEAWYWEMET